MKINHEFEVLVNGRYCLAEGSIDCDVDPGDPGVRTFSNGDPGYPPTAASAEATGCSMIVTDYESGRVVATYADLDEALAAADRQWAAIDGLMPRWYYLVEPVVAKLARWFPWLGRAVVEAAYDADAVVTRRAAKMAAARAEDPPRYTYFTSPRERLEEDLMEAALADACDDGPEYERDDDD